MSWIAPGTGARRESLNGTFDLGRPHGCPKPGVAQVMPAMPGAGGAALVQVIPKTDPSSTATGATVDRLDYTVFLLSSAKEHWDRSHDAKEAMVGGVAHSGGVIFAAAGVMVVRLRRVADTCPVRRALEAGFQFEERIVTPDGADLATAA